MRAGYLVLVVAALLAFWRLETPTPKPLDAPPQLFSATRAFGDIEAMAQQPHPVGSSEHERVKEHLQQRLGALGLVPLAQSERAFNDAFGQISAPITNIVAVLKGSDSSLPAVLVMSHYDSVPDSPGAADDSAGVASALEIARALKAAPALPRDVVFLFSDGEELGLMGATAFFRNNPLAAHIGAVINLEARGDAGLAAMFETGARNSETVSLWSTEASQPSTNSLSRALYKRMPNGTDFTPATAGGLPGVNFALIGDEAAYHSALATPAHLSLGSLQHMGDGGLAAVRAFAAKIPSQSSDSIYFDVLGFFVVQYSFVMGWILFGLTVVAVAFAIVAAQAVSSYSWRRGAIGMAIAIVLPTVALLLAGLSFGDSDHFLRLAHVDFLEAGAVALALGAALLGASLGRRKPLPAVWQWLLLVNLVLAYLLQRYVPEASFFLVWPLLAAALIAIMRFALFYGEDGVAPTAIAIVFATTVVAELACFAASLFVAVGVDMPVVIVLPILAALPLVLLVPGKLPSASLPILLLSAGVVLFAYGRLAPYTEERPEPSLIRHVADLDSKRAYRVDYLNVGDRWTKAALGAGAQQAALPWKPNGKTWWAATAFVAVPKTDIVFVRAGDDLLIVVKPEQAALFTHITLSADEGLREGTIDGAKTAATAPGRTQDLRYYLPGRDGVVWSVPAPKSGIVTVAVKTLYTAWPQGAAPQLPANKAPFGNTGTTETVTRKTWKP